MRPNAGLFLLVAMTFSVCDVAAQEIDNTAPSRHMTLQEAVQLALKHNHTIRIAGFAVEEKDKRKRSRRVHTFHL